MSEEDIKLLEDEGWDVVCESPFEIEMVEGGEQTAFASGEAAEIIFRQIKYRY